MKNMTNADTTEVYKIWRTSVRKRCFHFLLMLHLGNIKCDEKFQVNNRRYFTMLHRASRSAHILTQKIMSVTLAQKAIVHTHRRKSFKSYYIQRSHSRLTVSLSANLQQLGLFTEGVVLYSLPDLVVFLWHLLLRTGY